MRVDPDPEIVRPIPVAVPVAKVYDVDESPLIVVVAKYPFNTLPDHERLDPAENMLVGLAIEVT